jgi:hypothetical protein
MSWMTKLRGWVDGPSEDSDVQSLEPSLAALAGDLRRQAVALGEHAELAPNQHAERGLRRMAVDQGAAADHLRAVLDRRGLTLANGTAETAPASTDSHWARLVQDLEGMQAVRRRALELTITISDAEGDLVAALAEVSRTVETQLGRLRGLIARADPQALN